jgi:hypothetical protein
MSCEDQTVDSLMHQAAKELPKWLGLIPHENLGMYGFRSKEDISNARIGSPIISYHPVILVDSLSHEHLKADLLSGKVLLYFPVELNDSIVSLVRTSLSSTDSLNFRGIGYTFLADRVRSAKEYFAEEYSESEGIEALVRFVGPPIDIALGHDEKGHEVWLLLEGGRDCSVQRVSPAELIRLLQKSYGQ